MMKTILKAQIENWAKTNEMTMCCQVMTAAALGEPGATEHPQTVEAMGQCLKLAQDIPGLRERFSAIAVLSSQWYYLIENWDRLDQTYARDTQQFGRRSNKGQHTWELLQQLQAQSAAVMQF